MRVLLLLLTGIILSPFTGWAQWKFSDGSTRFSIKNAGLTVEGSFDGMSAVIQFDPAHPELAQIKATVEAKTVETGIALRNKHLRGKKYFDTDRFPLIKITVSRIRKSEDQWIASSQLTIKETTRPIEIPVQFVETGKTATLKSHFNLNRLDYKVGQSSWTMADQVQIEITANLTKL